VKRILKIQRIFFYTFDTFNTWYLTFYRTWVYLGSDLWVQTSIIFSKEYFPNCICYRRGSFCPELNSSRSDWSCSKSLLLQKHPTFGETQLSSLSLVQNSFCGTLSHLQKNQKHQIFGDTQLSQVSLSQNSFLETLSHFSKKTLLLKKPARLTNLLDNNDLFSGNLWCKKISYELGIMEPKFYYLPKFFTI